MSANKELEIKIYTRHVAMDHKASLNTSFEATIYNTGTKKHSIRAIKGNWKNINKFKPKPTKTQHIKHWNENHKQ